MYDQTRLVNCIVLKPLISTGKAYGLMNANHFTTFGTGPFLFFVSNEMPDPEFVDHFEIIDHARSVLISVSFIQMFQPGAGKTIATVGTIRDISFGELFAVFDLTGHTGF